MKREWSQQEGGRWKKCQIHDPTIEASGGSTIRQLGGRAGARWLGQTPAGWYCSLINV